MLLNLSNHPSEKWSTQQRDAAIAQFGDIADFEFPAIDPNMTLFQIKQLADHVVKQVSEFQIPDLSVHVMGEFTFTFNILLLFSKHEIPCYASTTMRTVEVNPDGSKTSVFRFVTFRPYY